MTYFAESKNKEHEKRKAFSAENTLWFWNFLSKIISKYCHLSPAQAGAHQDEGYQEVEIVAGDVSPGGGCHVCLWARGIRNDNEGRRALPSLPHGNNNYNLKEEFFVHFFPINYHQVAHNWKYPQTQKGMREIVSISNLLEDNSKILGSINTLRQLRCEEFFCLSSKGGFTKLSEEWSFLSIQYVQDEYSDFWRVHF